MKVELASFEMNNVNDECSLDGGYDLYVRTSSAEDKALADLTTSDVVLFNETDDTDIWKEFLYIDSK